MTLTVPKGALIALIALLVGAAVGFAGYKLGQASKDENAARADGFRTGREDAVANYSQGSPGWTTIHEDGRQAGYTDGFRVGRRQGLRQGLRKGTTTGERVGRSQGLTAGQDVAFEGYSGGWEVGRWYMIRIGTGKDVGLAGKYSIPTRVGPISFEKSYALCDDGVNVCSGPR
jgi:hypothetical protein